MRIHANDGISAQAEEQLKKHGFNITTQFVAQDGLVDYIKAQQVEALLVRSATKVRKDLIDACPSLKLIGRGGVGMDNIDVEYAKGKGIRVINTPASSSISVAELVMAHLFGLMRDLYKSNRRMAIDGDKTFKDLKKAYAKGTELRGKTLGIIGFGRIGQWVARYALGAGMKVIYTDSKATTDFIELDFNGQLVKVGIKMVTLPELLAQSDAISVHVPPKRTDGSPVIGAAELAMMKKGAVLVNTSRGATIDEDALLTALNNGHLKAAALDVFVNEPTPRADLIHHDNLSLSPHIGAATQEAQGRVGDELADLLIKWRDEVTVHRG